MNGRFIDQKPAYKKMLNAEVALQSFEKVVAGQVKQKELGLDDKIVGSFDAKHMLNSMINEVYLPDGQMNNYAANVITKNMLSQVDYKRYIINLVDSIVDFKRDD